MYKYEEHGLIYLLYVYKIKNIVHITEESKTSLKFSYVKVGNQNIRTCSGRSSTSNDTSSNVGRELCTSFLFVLEKRNWRRGTEMDIIESQRRI